jgi:hypothetical protein
VSKTEMADKHCGVESLKNSILDISESLKLFGLMVFNTTFNNISVISWQFY